MKQLIVQSNPSPLQFPGERIFIFNVIKQYKMIRFLERDSEAPLQGLVSLQYHDICVKFYHLQKGI